MSGKVLKNGLDKQALPCFPVVGSELRAEFGLTPSPRPTSRAGQQEQHQANELCECDFRMEPAVASIGHPSPPLRRLCGACFILAGSAQLVVMRAAPVSRHPLRTPSAVSVRDGQLPPEASAPGMAS